MFISINLYQSHFSLGFLNKSLVKLVQAQSKPSSLCVLSQTCWIFRFTKSSISSFMHLPYSFNYLLFDFFKSLKHYKVLFVKKNTLKTRLNDAQLNFWILGKCLVLCIISQIIDYFLVNFLNKIERIFPFCGAQRAHLGVKWR